MTCPQPPPHCYDDTGWRAQLVVHLTEGGQVGQETQQSSSNHVPDIDQRPSCRTHQHSSCPPPGYLGQSYAVLLKKNKIQDLIFSFQVSSTIVGYERFVFRFVSFVLRF